MGFNLIYWAPMSCSYFFIGSNLENFGKFGRADPAGLGKYCMGGYGRIEVHMVKSEHVCVCVQNYSSSNYIPVGLLISVSLLKFKKLSFMSCLLVFVENDICTRILSAQPSLCSLSKYGE